LFYHTFAWLTLATTLMTFRSHSSWRRATFEFENNGRTNLSKSRQSGALKSKNYALKHDILHYMSHGDGWINERKFIKYVNL
jgi:hypothetical protein